MSANTFFDIIEDTLIGELENEDSKLPDDLVITLEPEQLKALLTAGLAANDGKGESLSVDLTRVFIKVSGKAVLIRSTEDPIEEASS